MFCISDEPGPAIIPLEAEKSPGRYISKLKLYNHRHNYTGLYMDMDVLHVYLWCPLSKLVKYCNKPGSYCLLMTFYPKWKVPYKLPYRLAFTYIYSELNKATWLKIIRIVNSRVESICIVKFRFSNFVYISYNWKGRFVKSSWVELNSSGFLICVIYILMNILFPVRSS